ncbi:MAG: hypothetical protein KAI17_06015 [Thiotrichaceae bacterium]|nr:hypothetical protein [Thiotrichaceae bacterium]
MVNEFTHPDATVIVGTVLDDMIDEFRVTIIAMGIGGLVTAVLFNIGTEPISHPSILSWFCLFLTTLSKSNGKGRGILFGLIL